MSQVFNIIRQSFTEIENNIGISKVSYSNINLLFPAVNMLNSTFNRSHDLCGFSKLSDYPRVFFKDMQKRNLHELKKERKTFVFGVCYRTQSRKNQQLLGVLRNVTASTVQEAVAPCASRNRSTAARAPSWAGSAAAASAAVRCRP